MVAADVIKQAVEHHPTLLVPIMITTKLEVNWR